MRSCGLLILLLAWLIAAAAAVAGPAEEAVLSVFPSGTDQEKNPRAFAAIIQPGDFAIVRAAAVKAVQPGAPGPMLRTMEGMTVPAWQVVISDSKTDLALISLKDSRPPGLRIAERDAPLTSGDDAIVLCGSPDHPSGPTPAKLLGTPDGWAIETAHLLLEHCDRAPVLNAGGAIIGLVSWTIVERERKTLLVDTSILWDLLDQYRNPILGRRYFDLGLLYDARGGKTREAAEAYRNAVRYDPERPEAHNNLAAAYSRLGRSSEALKASQQAAQLSPGFAEAHYNRALIHEQLGQLDEAIAALLEAVTGKPDFGKAYDLLGVLYGKKRLYEKAAEAGRSAVRHEPEAWENHFHLGIACAAIARPEEAISALREALRIRPNADEVRYFLAIVYYGSGNADAAEEEYRILRERKPDLAEKLRPKIER